MKKIQQKSTIVQSSPTIVTIGTFDGVHLGHQEIIKKLVVQAEEYDLTPTLLTFFPHPRMVLQQDANIKLINTLEEKRQLLEKIGLKNLVVYPFTREFSRMTALDFVRDVLVNKVKVKKLIVGYDHRFGRNRTANIEDLKDFGQIYDFEVEQISAKEVDEVSVSSTKIRNALMEGDIKKANSYLGYAFMLNGKVIKGNALGREIDYPTANIHIAEEYKLIPMDGVYVIKSTIGDNQLFGMMNIGNKPTVGGRSRSVEVHFFDFDGSLYEQHLTIEMLHRLREERKFDSVDDLKIQLSKDKQKALNYIEKNDVG
ncbi:bifunctional riboflavin kinase/FAD synthetase [Sungkyunkwania multivorans]|uniref:Riboflavin biosynthesis protein n=1 Tax=Sungkyunkwania multivorans TaxID=1173618 RepID=A0ABW3CU25_9FLAO